METERIDQLKLKVLEGGELSWNEVLELVNVADKERLYAAAAEITAAMCPKDFDSCSIVNVRSGKCPENCKWCAQSGHYNTGCETYDLIPRQKCLDAARYNHSKGVRRFSLVASGKAVKGKELDNICSILREVESTVGISTCASLGLIGEDDFRKLWDAGVRRYHCNLETAPSYFPMLCTTHTMEDKIATINAARKVGFEVCSGGIIGMGETAEQRAELAFKLKEVEPHSIPVNILCPIPGTPLESAEPISEDEVLSAIAVFRFVHPRAQIRFAGGRAHLSRAAQIHALRIGVNGGITGDMLTTVGSQIDDDRALVSEGGYKF